jgi:hypothetical protein
VADELCHQARPGRDTTGLQYQLEPLRHREAAIGQVWPGPGEGVVPVLRLDSGDHRQLRPEHFKITRQYRLCTSTRHASGRPARRTPDPADDMS